MLPLEIASTRSLGEAEMHEVRITSFWTTNHPPGSLTNLPETHAPSAREAALRHTVCGDQAIRKVSRMISAALRIDAAASGSSRAGTPARPRRTVIPRPCVT